MTRPPARADGALRGALAVAALAGLGLAAYLTYVRFSGDDLACPVGGSCATVQESQYAELLGIPVPVLGLLGYAGLLLAAALPGPLGRALGLFTAVVSFGFSAWLTAVEAFILEAWCAWCVASAVLVTVCLVLCVARVIVGNRADEDAGDDAGDDAAPAAGGVTPAG